MAEKKSIDEFYDSSRMEGDEVGEENSINEEGEVRPARKIIVDLKKEEVTLKDHLEILKKDNFSLQATISAWHITLTKKLEEFKEADSKLNEVYSEIWREREEFCSKAEEFDDEQGILSDWWKNQMKFVSDLEDLGKKREEEKEQQQEIQKLEREVEELQREIEELEGGDCCHVDVHFTEAGDSCGVRCSETTEEVPIVVHPEGSTCKKKVRFLEEGLEQIQEYDLDPSEQKSGLFSIVDVERVRRASRHRNQKHLYGKVKKFLKTQINN